MAKRGPKKGSKHSHRRVAAREIRGMSEEALRAHRRTISDRHRARQLGLAIDQYKELRRLAQEGACDVCGDPPNKSPRGAFPETLHIDHCHETNRIRGLLCSRCNRALGYFRSNPRLLRLAAEYLERFLGID